MVIIQVILQNYLEEIQVNSFGTGVRYMLSPKFGLKLGFNYDKFTNQEGSGSLDFETYQYRANFEGVINAIRLFNVERSAGRFGLLLHGGIQKFLEWHLK